MENRTPSPTNPEQEVFSADFIKKFEEQEEELYRLQQRRQELRDEIKYFHMNQPGTEVLENCIKELMDFFKQATSDLPYGQHLLTDTPADIIKTLQQFEKYPIDHPHFKSMLFDLQLVKYEKILNIVDKNNRYESQLDSAVVDLEKVHNDSKTRSERAKAKTIRENDVMDDDICLEPLFSVVGTNYNNNNIQQKNVINNNLQNKQNNNSNNNNTSQRHRNDTLTQQQQNMEF